MIATGSQPVRLAIASLDQVTVWTSREATNVREIPGRVLLVGGSAVGVELGQFYPGWARRSPSSSAGRLVDREDPRVGELAAEALTARGVTVRTRVTRSAPAPPGRRQW
jgi:dihydrolipoamide dehydrogenase